MLHPAPLKQVGWGWRGPWADTSPAEPISDELRGWWLWLLVTMVSGHYQWDSVCQAPAGWGAVRSNCGKAVLMVTLGCSSLPCGEM